MTQGLFVNMARPRSKKAVKEAIASGTAVYAEATSFYGGEFEGLIYSLPEGEKVVFVGPDPHRDRRFYGTITKKNGLLRVT
jgi:hypothetical protein